jgi:uncharacterized membrane protein
MIAVAFPINIAILFGILFAMMCAMMCAMMFAMMRSLLTALQYCRSLALLKKTLDGVLTNTGASPLLNRSPPECKASPTYSHLPSHPPREGAD